MASTILTSDRDGALTDLVGSPCHRRGQRATPFDRGGNASNVLSGVFTMALTVGAPTGLAHLPGVVYDPGT